MNPTLQSAPAVIRHPDNPLLTADDVPYPCSLLFNAGVARFQGRYVMVFRNDYGPTQATFENDRRWDGTNLGLAFSDDGVRWTVEPEPCITLEKAYELAQPLLPGYDATKVIRRFYDPRLTVLDGRCYMCFAVDTIHGLRGGIAVTDDFDHFDVLTMTLPDNRNMVLFPEKVNGQYVRLERPMPAYGGPDMSAWKFGVWLSTSPDLIHWGHARCVLPAADVPFANDKIGPAAPPIKTERGWLTTFHAVDVDDARGKNGWEDTWKKRYTAGLMLLDLDDPSRRIGLCDTPLLAPQAPYETDGGFRNHVIFPGGMLLEPGGEVKIYYGAADAVECLATAPVDDLLEMCRPEA